MIPVVHFYRPPRWGGRVSGRGPKLVQRDPAFFSDFLRGWAIRLAWRTRLVHCNLQWGDLIIDHRWPEGLRVQPACAYLAAMNRRDLWACAVRVAPQPALAILSRWPGPTAYELRAVWRRPKSDRPALYCVTMTQRLLGQAADALTPDGYMDVLADLAGSGATREPRSRHAQGAR